MKGERTLLQTESVNTLVVAFDLLSEEEKAFLKAIQDKETRAAIIRLLEEAGLLP